MNLCEYVSDESQHHDRTAFRHWASIDRFWIADTLVPPHKRYWWRVTGHLFHLAAQRHNLVHIHIVRLPKTVLQIPVGSLVRLFAAGSCRNTRGQQMFSYKTGQIAPRASGKLFGCHKNMPMQDTSQHVHTSTQVKTHQYYLNYFLTIHVCLDSRSVKSIIISNSKCVLCFSSQGTTDPFPSVVLPMYGAIVTWQTIVTFILFRMLWFRSHINHSS